jgi:transposase
MPFKLDLVKKSLQPGVCVARFARENSINDNLLFTWRQRYRHLVAVSADGAGGDHLIAGDAIVPAVVERHCP